MFRFLIWLSALLPACALAAQTRVATDIGLTGVGIHAVSVVEADPRVLWQTLTDYDRLAGFVPGMTLSRLISPANAPTRVVEQKGKGGLLALILPDHVILELREEPYQRITFRSVSGWVTSMRGDWRIRGDRAPVTLEYRVHIVPALPPPPILTEDYVREEIRLRMDAVAREAERRMQMAR